MSIIYTYFRDLSWNILYVLLCCLKIFALRPFFWVAPNPTVSIWFPLRLFQIWLCTMLSPALVMKLPKEIIRKALTLVFKDGINASRGWQGCTRSSLMPMLHQVERYSITMLVTLPECFHFKQKTRTNSKKFYVEVMLDDAFSPTPWDVSSKIR